MMRHSRGSKRVVQGWRGRGADVGFVAVGGVLKLERGLINTSQDLTVLESPGVYRF
jgi:hypothetical protein